MAQTLDIDMTAANHQAEYLEFLDDDKDQGVYYTAIKNMIKAKEHRLVVNINDLRRKLPQRVKALMQNSIEEIVLFQRALKECILHLDPQFASEVHDVFIGFEGSFGKSHVTPRTLNTSQLGSIIAIEGIVTQCSLVQPKVVRSVHYCPATGKQIQRQYTDLTSFDAFPSSNVYPTKDEDGNPLETEYGLSEYKDNQMLSIQEMPEKAPSGQMPRQVEVIVDNDLVDLCKPGDRVLVVGPYRCLPSKQGNYTSGSFRTIMLGTQITHVIREDDNELQHSDLAKCKKFSKNRNAFDILARSLAPSIYGHEYVKKALLCMMLGGLEKILPNGTRIRGDINILLIGDPSVAKSQMLRYVLNSAPRAVSTTGRGSSGVGLTAAVTHDPETGDRRLEAGAMVLADRGIVCIDEFDKMSDIDRTAIHEVMEQGRVTITKAGIQAKLNARCSVLAAANPIYGRYDQYRTPMENIGLQDSLLSRFDLIFILLDTPNEEHDANIADHVIRTHQYRAGNEADGAATPINSDADFLNTKTDDKPVVEEDESIWEKFDPKLHGARRGGRGNAGASKVLSVNFMKKYIHIAKAIKPKMTKAASDIIAEEYSKLRAHDEEHHDMARTQPVTARALETLIRLSTAHARARLSTTIDPVDAKEAIQMVQFSHYQKVLEKPRKRNAHGEEEDDEEDNGEMDYEDDEEAMETEVTEKKTTSRKRAKTSDKPYEYDDEASEASQERTPYRSLERQTNVAPIYPEVKLSDERLKEFQKFLFAIFKKEMSQSMETEKIFKAAEQGENKFERAEVNAALKKMEDQNKIFVSGGLVILV